MTLYPKYGAKYGTGLFRIRVSLVLALSALGTTRLQAADIRPWLTALEVIRRP